VVVVMVVVVVDDRGHCPVQYNTVLYSMCASD